jgi:hypothetical protein
MTCRRPTFALFVGAVLLQLCSCGAEPDSTTEPAGAGGTTSAGGSGGGTGGTTVAVGGGGGASAGAAGATAGAGGASAGAGGATAGAGGATTGAGGATAGAGGATAGAGGATAGAGGTAGGTDGGRTDSGSPDSGRVEGGSTDSGGSTGDWTGFVYPTVTFTDEATALPGSTIFADCIPDVKQMMKDQCLLIAQELYTDNKDRRVTFNTLNLLLQDDPGGVAAKWGNATEVSIGVSAQYVATFYNNNGKKCDMVLKEVRGILSHEGAHGYQWSPKNCGSYDGSSTFWGFVEGEADGVRAELTNWTPTRYPSKGGNWNGGYTTGGFFLSWCKHNKKPTFLIELNHAARDMATFTWDAAFQQILGQSVQSVWNEYQATL